MQEWVSTQYHLNDEYKANKAPVIDDMKRYFVIPKGTAFLLTGSATDPDEDNLLYQWDQYDMPPLNVHVNSAKFNSNLATGPMFRVFPPTNVPYRFCPKLDRIKQGKLTDSGSSSKSPDAWETVPTVARELNFAFVVRDRKPRSGEAGNVAVDKVIIKVIDAVPFSISSFDSATTVSAGSMQTVRWNVGGTTNDEINTQTVTIKFASDGENFTETLASKVPNNGSCEVRFPSTNTRKGRIMIQGDDNIFIAINLGDITIN